jgi:thimet oligopeptidase
MSTCTVAETRKKMLLSFNNRAYPANKAILELMIKKRDELASILGFKSFADYELNSQMAKQVDVVDRFIGKLLEDFKTQIEKEFSEMTKNLPEGVELTEEGKLQAHDFSFASHAYKREKFFLDEEKISEYFPLDKTIQGLQSIYEKFFNLNIQEVSESALWHPDVRLLQIESKDQKELLGYLILDLFPRENKYAHACCASLVFAYTEKETFYPAACLIVTNFPKKTEAHPSLLSLDQVKTLFHEFGHALHNILGRSDMMMTCGTQVKTDFVELPSQLLEEWLSDSDILRELSCHYLTKKPLPDEEIAKVLKAKHCDSALWLQKQCFLSALALEYFKEGKEKDVDGILSTLRSKMLYQYAYDGQDHFAHSFAHLDGYGSKYYGYLWSRVFAADVFAEIKKMGLLNPCAGALYREKILGKGGSADPNSMLQDFLGREPTSNFFIQNLRDLDNEWN